MKDISAVPGRPVLLVILDGFGENPCRINNGVAEADTPRLDAYLSRNPHTVLQASGRAVGLPDGQMGNSEVGHMTLGCGAIVRQDLVRIDDAIADGSFHRNEALVAAAKQARANRRPLHLVGLVSDGGVHSHIRHLLGLMEICRRYDVTPMVHMITDGRDTAPDSAPAYLAAIQSCLDSSGAVIATVMGRYYAMDRDARWQRTEEAWRAMVLGDGHQAQTAAEAISQAYERGETDEFIRPTVVAGGAAIEPDDAVIFFNFRRDRPRQLVSALFREEFDGFDRGADFQPIPVTCMTEYDQWFELPTAFDQERPAANLAQVVSDAGLRQFHCAETEKYAHVTFFLNGGRGDAYSGEEREIIPSPRVATYDLAPEMSAHEVADTVINAVLSGEYPLIVVNFANGDMVGHTAVREAILTAVETLDREVGRLLDEAVAAGYSVILTADHGNCDEMVDPITGGPHTQHSVYPVPCMVIDERPWRLSVGGGLANVAPTVLQLMGLSVPKGMTEDSLLLEPLA